MYYNILWDRLAGLTKEFVENYLLSKAEKTHGAFHIEPSYPVDYKIKNIDKILDLYWSKDSYFVFIIGECRNINDLPTEVKELVSQYLPRFFAKYPEYKAEQCLKIKN